jgi:excisionase family DNA binding protein
MDDWITTAEAAKLSGYTLYHVRRLITSDKLKARKWGPVWQVSRRALLAYVRAAEQAGEKRGPKRTA